MTRKEAIEFIEKSTSSVFTYGLEGSDLGTPVARDSAIEDIKNMEDIAWHNGDIYELEIED